jgi:hypothetical protein
VAVIVLALNLAKGIVMLVVSRRASNRALITIGDVISSFLETPDRYTEGLCAASYKDFKRMRESWGHAPKVYTRIPIRYFSAAKIQWTMCIGLYVHVPPFRWLKSDRYASYTTDLIFGWYFMIASG